MITTHPEYYLRRPLPPSGPVMHIYGLPPFCKPTDGWKPVKDLLRAVLAKHGLCHAESGKPGMVHNTTDYDVQSRRERIWAQCNLKSTDAAKCAFEKIAGNTWFGHPLTAAVYSNSSDGLLQYWSGVPVTKDRNGVPVPSGCQPCELSEEFAIDTRVKHSRWTFKADNMTAQRQRKGDWSKKRPDPSPEPEAVHKRYHQEVPSITSSCLPDYCVPEQVPRPTGYTERSVSMKAEDEDRGWKLHWGEAFYEHYQETDSDTILVDHQEIYVRVEELGKKFVDFVKEEGRGKKSEGLGKKFEDFVKVKAGRVKKNEGCGKETKGPVIIRDEDLYGIV